MFSKTFFKAIAIVLGIFCNVHVFAQNVFPSSGFVGIGTSTPADRLHVLGYGATQQIIETVGDGYSMLSLKSNDRTWQLSKRPNSQADLLALYYHDGTNWVVNPYMIIAPSGSIGYYTGNPRGVFDISKDGDIYMAFATNGGSSQKAYFPGHLRLAPFGNTDIAYLQAGREDGQSTTQLRFRTVNNGTVTEAMHINGIGNVGIGTNGPQEKLEVMGNIKSTGLIIPTNAAAGRVLTSDANGNASWQIITGGSGSSSWSVSGADIVNANVGFVGIGTSTNPMPLDNNLKLAVKGNIYAQKLKVTISGWADYVFHPTYKLPSLLEVESFIKKYQHLPEIPSANDVEKNGIDVGDNQALLLKKIEELTLYVIDLNKEVQQLKTQLADKQKNN